MAEFPSLDQYDLAVVLSSAGLLIIGYVIYPTHLVRVSVWFTIFTLYLCWMAYFAYRWTYDDEEKDF